MEPKFDDVGKSLEETKSQLNELQQYKEEFEVCNFSKIYLFHDQSY